jgi:hypothetical protein
MWHRRTEGVEITGGRKERRSGGLLHCCTEGKCGKEAKGGKDRKDGKGKKDRKVERTDGMPAIPRKSFKKRASLPYKLASMEWPSLNARQ